MFKLNATLIGKKMSLDEFKEVVGEYWHDSLKELESKYRKIVARAVKNVAEKNGLAARGLAEKSGEILEVGGIDGYKVVSESVSKLAEKNGGTAYELAWRAAEILDAAGVEGYQTVVGVVEKKIAKNRGRAAFWLASISGKILKICSVDRYVAVAEAVNKVAKKDVSAAYDLISRSAEILNRIDKNKEITTDEFLIESIRDQKDAQLIGPVLKRESYPLYLEKVERFY